MPMTPPSPCRARRSGAFTLIELLVVISIIALLIGILLPALGAARQTARVTTDLTQQRQIITATATYTIDYDGHYPLAAQESNPRSVSVDELLIPYLSGGSYSFQDALADQYVTKDEFNMVIWHSPLDTEENLFALAGGEQKRSYAINRGKLTTTSDNSWDAQHNSGIMRTASIDANGTVTAANGGSSLSVDDVTSSSNTIAFSPNFTFLGYCGWQNLGDTTAYEVMRPDRSYTTTGNWAADLNRFYGYANGGKIGDDPSDYSVNFAFCDGHAGLTKGVETLNPDQPKSQFRTDGQSLWNARK